MNTCRPVLSYDCRCFCSGHQVIWDAAFSVLVGWHFTVELSRALYSVRQLKWSFSRNLILVTWIKLWVRRSYCHFWDSLSNQLLKESRSCNTFYLCNQFDNDHKIYTTMIWLEDRTSYSGVALVVQKTPPKQNISFQSKSPVSTLRVPASVCVCARVLGPRPDWIYRIIRRVQDSSQKLCVKSC